ncbi:Testis-specific protein TSX [Lemmus lemmus]
MSEEQTPQTSEAECRTMDSPEFENEERWLYKVLGIKLMPSSALDDDMEKQEDKSLGSAEADDGINHSDSDIDNVKVIIGNGKTNPSTSLYVTLNVLGLWDLRGWGERNTMGVTSPLTVLNLILGARWNACRKLRKSGLATVAHSMLSLRSWRPLFSLLPVSCVPFLADDFGIKLFRILLF